MIALLAPALLAALVITETFGTDDSELVLDERALGVAAAGGALALAPDCCSPWDRDGGDRGARALM